MEFTPRLQSRRYWFRLKKLSADSLGAPSKFLILPLARYRAAGFSTVVMGRINSYRVVQRNVAADVLTLTARRTARCRLARAAFIERLRRGASSSFFARQTFFGIPFYLSPGQTRLSANGCSVYFFFEHCFPASADSKAQISLRQ